ncbi:hypothetical protein ACGF07_35335 [Kitasatospora sp. NPDC048194]|uniref:hypothetical protein n=1 Tax=Kitasatospora sp. NPDC048194 TaxID=3364045 RepID=UPI00371C3BEF
MSQHADVRPGDCASCSTLFTQLSRHTDPARLTIARLGELAKLGRRATFLHLAHLETRGLIGEDRRTPVEGATLERPAFKPRPAATALDWATSVKTPHRACGKLLCAYAAHGWRGQLKDAVLAKAAGLSVRTIERHRPCLGESGAKLIYFTRDQINDANGRLRNPDRYTLNPGLARVEMPKAPTHHARDDKWFHDIAEALLLRMPWFASAPWESGWETTRQRGIGALARAYKAHAGTWGEADWYAHLHRDTPVNRPLFHLRQLIATADPTRPPVSGSPEYTATGTTAPLLPVTCERCEKRAFRPTEPGRTVCGPCREEAERANDPRAAHAAFERLLGPISNPLGKAV